MTHVAFAPPLRSVGVLVWAIFIALTSMILIYFAGIVERAMSIFSGMHVHESVHDRRHLLGFPRH